MRHAIIDMKDFTTVRIEKSTRAALDSIGVRKESYNTIILRLLEFYNRRKR